MWRDIKGIISEMWFAPMFWPLLITFAIGEWTAEYHWSVFVMLLPFVLAFIMIGILVMLPVQAVVIVAVLVAAPFAFLYHIFTKD